MPPSCLQGVRRGSIRSRLRGTRKRGWCARRPEQDRHWECLVGTSACGAAAVWGLGSLQACPFSHLCLPPDCGTRSRSDGTRNDAIRAVRHSGISWRIAAGRGRDLRMRTASSTGDDAPWTVALVVCQRTGRRLCRTGPWLASWHRAFRGVCLAVRRRGADVLPNAESAWGQTPARSGLAFHRRHPLGRPGVACGPAGVRSEHGGRTTDRLAATDVDPARHRCCQQPGNPTLACCLPVGCRTMAAAVRRRMG